MSLNAYLSHAALAKARQQARKTPQEPAQAADQGQPLTQAAKAPQRPAKPARKAKAA